MESTGSIHAETRGQEQRFSIHQIETEYFVTKAIIITHSLRIILSNTYQYIPHTLRVPFDSSLSSFLAMFRPPTGNLDRRKVLSNENHRFLCRAFPRGVDNPADIKNRISQVPHEALCNMNFIGLAMTSDHGEFDYTGKKDFTRHPRKIGEVVEQFYNEDGDLVLVFELPSTTNNQFLVNEIRSGALNDVSVCFGVNDNNGSSVHIPHHVALTNQGAQKETHILGGKIQNSDQPYFVAHPHVTARSLLTLQKLDKILDGTLSNRRPTEDTPLANTESTSSSASQATFASPKDAAPYADPSQSNPATSFDNSPLTLHQPTPSNSTTAIPSSSTTPSPAAPIISAFAYRDQSLLRGALRVTSNKNISTTGYIPSPIKKVSSAANHKVRRSIIPFSSPIMEPSGAPSAISTPAFGSTGTAMDQSAAPATATPTFSTTPADPANGSGMAVDPNDPAAFNEMPSEDDAFDGWKKSEERRIAAETRAAEIEERYNQLLAQRRQDDTATATRSLSEIFSKIPDEVFQERGVDRAVGERIANAVATFDPSLAQDFASGYSLISAHSAVQQRELEEAVMRANIATGQRDTAHGAQLEYQRKEAMQRRLETYRDIQRLQGHNIATPQTSTPAQPTNNQNNQPRMQQQQQYQQSQYQNGFPSSSSPSPSSMQPQSQSSFSPSPASSSLPAASGKSAFDYQGPRNLGPTLFPNSMDAQHFQQSSLPIPAQPSAAAEPTLADRWSQPTKVGSGFNSSAGAKILYGKTLGSE
jgi:hypothetical protein